MRLFHAEHKRNGKSYLINIEREIQRRMFVGTILIDGSEEYKVMNLSTANVKRFLNKRIKQLNEIREINPKLPEVKINLTTSEMHKKLRGTL